MILTSFSRFLERNFLQNPMQSLKANFHSVEFSERTGNLLFTRVIVALNLNKMLRVTDLLLCLFPSAQKILLSGNQPKRNDQCRLEKVLQINELRMLAI